MSAETDPWQQATAIEPTLADLERFVSNQTCVDLPSVENWVARFTRIFNGRPELQSLRKAAFGHLLRIHNAAVQKSEAAK